MISSMKKVLSVLLLALPMFALTSTPQSQGATLLPAKFVKYHISIQNEATGAVIGDWSIVTQDGVPTPIQSIRETPYRSLVTRVTLSADPSAPEMVKETTEKSFVKIGTTLLVVPHVMPNGDVMTSLLLSYTSLDAMRTATIEGQTIDLPYTTTTHAENAILTTPAKPETVFELNPQDKYMKPGDHGYGVPLMFKVSARVE